MDYGQNPKQPFFQVGNGVIPETDDVFDAKNNLDLTNQADEWGSASITPPVPDAPASVITPASPAINHEATVGPIPIQPSSEMSIPRERHEYISRSEYANLGREVTSSLGEVVNIEQNPRTIPDQQQPLNNEQPANYIQSNIKTTDKLGEAGVREVIKVVRKLESDGNAASFYDTARNMMETNLKNSYGENANWKEAA